MNGNGSTVMYASFEGYDPNHPSAVAPIQPPVRENPTAPTAAAAKARAAPKPKKRLACGACRARRIRCPGEPEARKKTKKVEAGPQQPTSDIIKTQDELSRFALGGALTFHLIESLFVMANPCVPGMNYHLYRDLLHASGGSSREAEIAAECLCSAMIASSAAFSDHPVIVGAGEVETPTEVPEGGAYAETDFNQYLQYGKRRKDAVRALANRSYALFDESGIKDRPGIETIYTLLALDQCASLTSDDTRRTRDFVRAAADQMRHMLARAGEVSDKQLDILQGPLGRHIIASQLHGNIYDIPLTFWASLQSLDAQTAATHGEPLALTNDELEALLPQIDVFRPPHVSIRFNLLVDREMGWTELGKQLAPMQLLPFQADIIAAGLATNDHSLAFLWNSLDSGASILDSCAAHLKALPALDPPEETARRQFDLESLITSHRRSLLQLDLVLHQTIVEAAMTSDDSDVPDTVIQAYETSRTRTQKTFAICVNLAKQHVDHRSLILVKKLLDVMEVCTLWSSLRTADQESAEQCVVELGLSRQDCQILIKALSLAAWTSASALEQIEGLERGMPHS
ncbi:hypothetical protein OIV83_001436 [Microbotryomycetes sp. JL201]|nr:hypothetical protein OIV83_001436 [Microbotryomycetes sp. JL201]